MLWRLAFRCRTVPDCEDIPVDLVANRRGTLRGGPKVLLRHEKEIISTSGGLFVCIVLVVLVRTSDPLPRAGRIFRRSSSCDSRSGANNVG